MTKPPKQAEPRQWTIGCIKNGAADGGDIFAVTKSKQKVSFNDIIEGIEVVELSAYQQLAAELAAEKAQSESLSEKLAALTKENGVLKTELEKKEKFADVFGLNNLMNERDALAKENEVLREHGINMENSWIDVTQERDSLTARNAKLTTELDSFKKTNAKLVEALEQIAQRKGFALDLVRFQAGDSLASTMKNIAIEALKANEETPK
jgi:chromosome segregation ATPase